MKLAEILMPAIERVNNSDYERSISAKISNMMPEIEMAIKEGFRIIDIIDVLNSNQLKISFKTFESAIYRIRKKHKDASHDKIISTHKSNTAKKIADSNKREQPISLLKSKVARQEAVEQYFDNNKVSPLTKQLLDSLENDEHCNN